MKRAVFHLKQAFFAELPHEVFRNEAFRVELFRYPTGIEAIRVSQDRGHVVILPYYGHMIWEAVFDGVPLKLENRFQAPRPAADIVGTYGCFMYHSGLLRNGNPGPGDTHALHGEMPLAPMDLARIEAGEDASGPWLAVVGERDYLMGFGDHYRACPRVLLRPGATTFEIAMDVANLGADPMDLMYMCHANFAFVDGGQILQPARFDRQDTVVRTSVPAIVKSDPEYLQRIAAMREDPSATERLDASQGFDPELVFYIRHLQPAADGLVHVMLRRPAGDAFSMVYDPEQFSHLVRWILANHKQRVCAFAMPATCGVEGYRAEAEQGHVRTIQGGQTAHFSIRLGYLDAGAAAAEAQLIRACR
jgi:hypothetical protein